MKAAWSLLLPLALASSGCLELPHQGQTAKPAPAPKPVVVKPVRPPMPVTPGQVTEANANAVANRLEEEIARDQESESPAIKPTRP